MKKILFSFLFCAAFLSGLAQVPFNANLIIKSGTKDNLIIKGTDTLKVGWRTDRFQLKYNTNKRFIDLIKSDSTVIIYNKLILESPNDTLLSVRGNLKADTIFGVTQMPYQSYVARLTENLQWANSGPLVVGETYRIDALNTGDDFSNVGYMMPEMSFVATGTTPTNWSNGTYILNVTQSNPIVIVLYNSIGNVAWKYTGMKGSYRATFSESYDFNKIAIFPAIPTLPPLQVITQGLTTYEGVGFFLNSYLIDASLNSYQADGVFTDYMLEVRIYP